MKRRLLLAAAMFCALAGPLLQQAALLGLSPANGLVLGALAVLAVLAAAAGVLAIGERGSAAVMAVIVLAFADAAFGLRALADRSTELLPALSQPVALAMVVSGLVVATLSVNRLLRPHTATLLTVFLLASTVAAAAPLPSSSPPPRPSAPDNGRPVLLHLILDSLQSPIVASTGLALSPPLIDNARALAGEGFHIYAEADSQYSQTNLSLGSLFDERGYFDRLAAAGYRLEVFHRASPDLCSHPAVVACDTALSRPTPRAMREMLERKTAKVGIAAAAALLARPGSLISDAALLALGRLAPSLWHFSQPLEAREVLERAMARAAVAPPGTAIIAHVLLPHHPFALDQNCHPVERPPEDWIGQDSAAPSLADRQRHFAAYNDQVLCTWRTIRARLPGLERVAVVIHGDHASRVVVARPLVPDTREPNLTATMLAVRGPGITPGWSDQPVPLKDAFRAAIDALLSQGS